MSWQLCSIHPTLKAISTCWTWAFSAYNCCFFSFCHILSPGLFFCATLHSGGRHMTLVSDGYSLNRARENGSFAKSNDLDGWTRNVGLLWGTGYGRSLLERWARIIHSTFVTRNLLIDSHWIGTQDLPLEYNTWLLFRQVVDVILLKSVMHCQYFIADSHELAVIFWPIACLPLRPSEYLRTFHCLSIYWGQPYTNILRFMSTDVPQMDWGNRTHWV